MRESMPLVTVCCITYNHEKYICDALEGFLRQNTTFPFEVIVHDDASTDKTADIIRKYEEKYPNIIKPIYQKKNQYANGKDILLNFILPKAKGKYIALCEGDDYWTDEKKLQTQFEYIEDHPECSCVVHKLLEYSVKEGAFYDFPTSDYSRFKNGVFSPEQVIEDQSYLSSVSMFFRKEHFIINGIFYESIGFCFDYVMAIMLATEGEVHFIPEIMAVYRKGVEGSWTERVASNDEKRSDHMNLKIKYLEAINEYRQYKYDLAIKNSIQKIKVALLFYVSDKYTIKSPKYSSYLRSMSCKEKAKLYLKLYAPHIYEQMIDFVRWIRKRKKRKCQLQAK